MLQSPTPLPGQKKQTRNIILYNWFITGEKIEQKSEQFNRHYYVNIEYIFCKELLIPDCHSLIPFDLNYS